MAKDFYTEWLGIPPGVRPPDHYTLLGVPQFCRDMDAVENTTRARLSRLDEYAMHPDRATRDAVQDMMNAVARARVVLVNSRRRQAYDGELARTLGVPPPEFFEMEAKPPPEPAAAEPAVSRTERPAQRPRAAVPTAEPEPPSPVLEPLIARERVREFERVVWAHLRRWRVNAHEERLLVAEAATFGIDADQAMEIIHRIEREAESQARKESRRTTAIVAGLGFAAAVVLVAVVAWTHSARVKRERQRAFETHISQARECLGREDLEGTLMHLAEANAVFPDHRHIHILREELDTARGELRKTARSLVVEARDHMRRDDLRSAGNTLARARNVVTKIVPEDRRLASGLQQLEEERTRTQRLQAMLVDADKACERGDFRLASKKVGEAEHLLRDNRQAARHRNALDARRQAIRAGRRKKQTFETGVADVRKALGSGHLQLAQEKLDHIRALFPDDLRLATLRAAIAEKREETFKACVANVREALASGDLQLAEKKLDEAGRLCAGDLRLATLRAAIAEKREKTFVAGLANVRVALASGDLQLAEKKLDEAGRLYPGDLRGAGLRANLAARKKQRAYTRLMRKVRSVLANLPAGPLRVTEAQRARIVNAIRDAQTALTLKPGDLAATALAAKLSLYTVDTLKLADGVSMRLRWVPAGQFLMVIGILRPRQCQVTISKPFCIGVTEVTQAQWKVVMATEPWKGWKGWKVKMSAQNAASCISWDDATAFCKKLSQKVGRTVRLPTEAEWEYACRAGSKTKYYFGDDHSKLGDYAWYDKNAAALGDNYAHPVGRKKPNAWGLYDMHGNVCEWCLDYRKVYYYAPWRSAVDPKGPASGSCRVLRGGSFSMSPGGCHSAHRGGGTPDLRHNTFGFRVVLPVVGRGLPR